MKTTNTYLHFDGNCREAMTFYGKCLQAEPNFTTFAAGPAGLPEIAKTAPNRILHAELASGPVVLMASDTLPGMPFHAGNNFSISLTCESLAEMEKLFAAFSENGKITMPMHDAFWGGRFGMLIDPFGISWMFSFR
jgi:PhnB protein